MAEPFRAFLVEGGTEEGSRNVCLHIVRNDRTLKKTDKDEGATRRRNPRRSSTCPPVPIVASTPDPKEFSMLSRSSKKQTLEAGSSTPAKRTTRAATRATAAATPRSTLTATPKATPPATMRSSSSANTPTTSTRRTTRAQSKQQVPPPKTTSTAAAPPSPIWLLLLVSTDTTTGGDAPASSFAPDVSTAIAAYRILGSHSVGVTTDTSTGTGGGRTNRKRAKQKKTCRHGSSCPARTMMTISDCSGTATFTICPAATADADADASYQPIIATRRRPNLPVCFLQPYAPNPDSHPPSSACLISTFRFQTLVEANYFATTLRSASRLAACAELGSASLLSSTTVPPDGGNVNPKRQLANDIADEMLTTSACGPTSTSTPSAVGANTTIDVSPITKKKRRDESSSDERGGSGGGSIEATCTAETITKSMSLKTSSDDDKGSAAAAATAAAASTVDVDMRPPTPDLETIDIEFTFDNSDGEGSPPAVGLAVTTPRRDQQPVAVAAAAQEENEYVHSEWELSPIPHSEVGDANVATPTRKFLSSLFDSDVCMTPFALL